MPLDVAEAIALAADAPLWAERVLDLRLDDWQADIVRAHGSQLVVTTRQGGKSTGVAIRALHDMLFVPAAMVIAASPSEDQSKELFRKLTGFYDRLQDPPRAVVRNTTELELANGARCCAVPGSERTIRSKSAVTLLIIDEAARIDDGLISGVTPMLSTTDGDLIALTTPYGRRGWFYQQWKNGGDLYLRTRVTADQCSRISPAFLAKERARLGPLAYGQEYECSFVEGGSSVFTDDMILACLDRSFRPFP
jgi:hypothetical protein